VYQRLIEKNSTETGCIYGRVVGMNHNWRKAVIEVNPTNQTKEPENFARVAQRFALPACGWAWTLFGSRKNPKPEKCSKMPQNPTRQVHALLGSGFDIRII
jgi:hypothetical protein